MVEHQTSGNVEREQTERPSAALRQTFLGRPPATALQTFANSGEPPYGQSSGFAPRIIAPLPPPTHGPQPTYHVKVTAIPIRPSADGAPRRHSVTTHSFQNEVGMPDPGAILSGRNQEVTAHCIPDARNLQYQKGTPVVRVAPVEEKEKYGGHVGGQVHTYYGSTGQGPHILAQALAKPGEEGPVYMPDIETVDPFHIDEQQKPTETDMSRRMKRGSHTIPRHRVKDDDVLEHFKQESKRIDEVAEERQRSEGRMQESWWKCMCSKLGVGNLLRRGSTLSSLTSQYSEAFKNQLGGDECSESTPGSLPPDSVPLETGYSRLVPELVDVADEEKPRQYSWIAPNDEAGVPDVAPSTRRQSTVSSRRVSEPSGLPVLTFQDSGKLGEFLAAPRPGLVWQQKSESFGNGSASGSMDEDEFDDEDEVHNRPAIIYGGKQHLPPKYGGSLAPMTMVVHAAESHQYIPIEGVRTPEIIFSKIRPNVVALNGPAPLPFNPDNTGMPAPAFSVIASEGKPDIKLSPLLQSWFKPNLPVRDPKTDELYEQRGSMRGSVRSSPSLSLESSEEDGNGQEGALTSSSGTPPVEVN